MRLEIVCVQDSFWHIQSHIQTLLLFGAFMKSFKKTKLMPCKPLFIVHVRVKDLFKGTYTGVQKQSASVAKVVISNT